MAEYFDMDNRNLVVLVPGFPGWGLTDYYYWDTLTFDSQWTREINTKIILVQPGSMSSHHDRACEIFAQLMGIVTDFGSDHSDLYQHKRFGRDFTNERNIRRVWSATNPITFICHCAGINTIRYLQYLMDQDFWNLKTNSTWIKTIVSINGNINGTQFMHFFDKNPTSGVGSREILMKAVKQVYNGALWAVNRKKHLTEDQKNAVIEWNLQHWNIETKNKKWLPFKSINDTHFLENKDNLFYDLTIHGCKNLNDLIGNGYNKTYYISFYGKATDYDSPIQLSHTLNPLLFRSSTYVLHHSFTNGPLNSDFYKTADWRNNDGMYSLACQMYPLDSNGATQFCELKSLNLSEKSNKIEHNCWYYGDLQSIVGSKNIIDHFSMVWSRTFLKPHKFQITSDEQKKFYINLLTFLSQLS